MSKFLASFVIAGLLLSGFGMALDAEGPYKVGKRDILTITVPGNPELSLDVAVSEKGAINYPILGEIAVDGSTVSQVSEMIRESLVARKILVQPTVIGGAVRGRAANILFNIATAGTGGQMLDETGIQPLIWSQTSSCGS